MTMDNRKICLCCAWRAHCAKRFSRGDDASLHCPDFSEDVSLRKASGSPACPNDESDHGNQPS